MELAAKYAYEIYQKKSFSEAAKSLFISQPALSASIARLEKELGFQIFDRSTVPVSLTASGRIYVDSLEEILESERHMNLRIRQLSDVKKDSLAIGGLSNAAYYLLPVLCKSFIKEFPDIRIELDMASTRDSERLSDELKRQNIDLMVSYGYDPKLHRATPILHEKLIIAMHKDLVSIDGLAAYVVTRDEVVSKSYPESKLVRDFSIFKDVPFLRFKKGSFRYQEMSHVLGYSISASPHTVSHVTHSRIHYDMMCAGMGALLTTDSMVRTSALRTDEILYFIPDCPQSDRTIYLISNASVPQSSVAEAFIRTSRRVCESGEAFSLYL